MASTNKLKWVLLASFSLAVFGWAISATLSPALGVSVEGEPAALATIAGGNPDDFVGSETCATCHEDQFKQFKGTKHARLKDIASWKDKAQGCESCHGAGKAHVEGAGDITKIISFRNKNAKETSETCMSCHSGKETHNNFRRGEHWRNDVGCTDCHNAHGTTLENQKSGSQMFVSPSTRQNPGTAVENMLKTSEPQLCLGCHVEQKQQFAKPFRHKVLEGTMKCSDCHNAHGGFENKQTKVAVGSDQSCVQCHANKFGPFVFEHAPAKLEGCAACHTPHGSANPKMLKRSSVRQMCLECHTGLIDTAGELALPALHNQAQIRYMQCTVCHSAIHGSNTNFYLTR